ncbi:hypothetical protein, partial [Ruegeria aquimaris]|uniref:hypothetical protein n=1 Tax=Ruegeria aquimaris TaxID=2984333 RepID=UPI0021E7DE5B
MARAETLVRTPEKKPISKSVPTRLAKYLENLHKILILPAAALPDRAFGRFRRIGQPPVMAEESLRNRAPSGTGEVRREDQGRQSGPGTPSRDHRPKPRIDRFVPVPGGGLTVLYSVRGRF